MKFQTNKLKFLKLKSCNFLRFYIVFCSNRHTLSKDKQNWDRHVNFLLPGKMCGKIDTSSHIKLVIKLIIIYSMFLL